MLIAHALKGKSMYTPISRTFIANFESVYFYGFFFNGYSEACGGECTA
jgi:hypothetical protein